MVCFGLSPTLKAGSLKAGEVVPVSQPKVVRQGEQIPSRSALYSFQAVSGLGEAHSNWDQFALFIKAVCFI